jgi:hypothetical protein
MPWSGVSALSNPEKVKIIFIRKSTLRFPSFFDQDGTKAVLIVDLIISTSRA